jgi:hypothetical protein
MHRPQVVSMVSLTVVVGLFALGMFFAGVPWQHRYGESADWLQLSVSFGLIGLTVALSMLTANVVEQSKRSTKRERVTRDG